MANPRQRRKAKSSAHKAISHSKRAKRLRKKMPAIRGPKALQDAWDSSKTLRQNYLALGLEHDLNPVLSGGSEVHLGRVVDEADTSARPRTRTSDSDGAGLPKGFGRLIRDSSGNVIQVELPRDEDTPERELMIDDGEAVATEAELRVWARSETSGGLKDGIVRDLERLGSGGGVVERHTSLGERAYLVGLVNKYGDDLEKMSRDRRLNPDQRTGGELKRAISKAGGFEALCGRTAIGIAE